MRQAARCIRCFVLLSLPAGLLVPSPAEAQTISRQSPPSAHTFTTTRSAPVFIENRGQFDSRVRFQVKAAGKVLWLTNQGIVFDERKSSTAPPPDRAHSATPVAPPSPVSETMARLVFSENFVDSNEHPAIEAKGPQAGTYNYILGSDPAKWHTDVRGYGELLYRDVWPGIDVRVAANGPNLEQEFVVRPGGDLRKVQVSYEGIEKLEVSKDGSLAVHTGFDIIRETKPTIYQELAGKRVTVKGRFAIAADGRAYTFDIGSHRTEYALVIDPTVLLYSTYLGGTGYDFGFGIAADAAGNSYVAGYTQSPDFPTTTGAFQTALIDGSAAFVTKLNAVGAMVYSTFLSGTFTGGPYATPNAFARGIAVDAAGEAYVTGTADGGFPTTSNAYNSGCGNAFVTQLNAAGNGLVYSTCLGGSSGGQGIALDTSGIAYVTGTTTGNGFPTTANAFQTTLAPATCQGCSSSAAFIAVINPALSGAASLVYSTYLGGGENDGGYAIAVDAYSLSLIHI